MRYPHDPQTEDDREPCTHETIVPSDEPSVEFCPNCLLEFIPEEETR